MSAEKGNKVHPDIVVDFDEFDRSRVIRVNLCDLMDPKIVPKGYLKPDDGYILYNLFSEEECNRIMEVTEKIGYEKLIGYDLTMRDNLRIKCKSETIIGEWQKRVKQLVEPEMIISDEVTTVHKGDFHNGLWKFHSLNPFLRLCKYNPKNKFDKHYDYGLNPNPMTLRSFKTCMTYLNENYDDGHTRFFHVDQSDGSVKYPLFLKLKPKMGMCLIFNQNIYHDGEVVNNGNKYMMRTDIIYKAHKLDRKLTEDEKKELKYMVML